MNPKDEEKDALKQQALWRIDRWLRIRRDICFIDEFLSGPGIPTLLAVVVDVYVEPRRQSNTLAERRKDEHSWRRTSYRLPKRRHLMEGKTLRRSGAELVVFAEELRPSLTESTKTRKTVTAMSTSMKTVLVMVEGEDGFAVRDGGERG